MQYTAYLNWQSNDRPFEVKTYDRTHTIKLGSGTEMNASSAPEFLGNPALVNPEELFTASIASCFMLTFLYWAAMKGLKLNHYTSEAIGTLAKNAEGKMAMTEVIIKPVLTFENNQQPDTALLDELFKKAHEQCFISSSVKTKVTVLSEQMARAQS